MANMPSDWTSASNLAAWWGAAVATVVMIWDIIKWRREQAAIRVTASPNMQFIGRQGLSDEKHIVVTVTNTGGQTTTVTHVVVFHYPGLLRQLIRRPDMQGAIPDPRPGRLPHVLPPGEIWTGVVDQADLLGKSRPGGRFYCGVVHSLERKPVVARVRL
jgi:hypothetical protein